MAKTSSCSAASVAADVLASVKNSRPGFADWCDKLPADYREQFLEARKNFDPKKHQFSAYARAIIAVGQRHGLAMPGEGHLVKWLKRRSPRT